MIHKNEFIEILKVISGMSYDEVRGHLNVDSWPCPEEFDDFFNGMRKDLFHGLCDLDEDNQSLLVDRAFDKMIQARARIRCTPGTIGVFVPAKAPVEPVVVNIQQPDKVDQ
jgi:hypothetical protein